MGNRTFSFRFFTLPKKNYGSSFVVGLVFTNVFNWTVWIRVPISPLSTIELENKIKNHIIFFKQIILSNWSDLKLPKRRIYKSLLTDLILSIKLYLSTPQGEISYAQIANLYNISLTDM